MDLGLAGKRVIISGASRGIGRTTAETFLREGAQVAICARGAEVLDTTAKELAELGSVYHEAFDVGDAAAAAEFVDRAAAHMGGLDAVVVSASALSVKGPESWRISFETDFMSLVTFIEAATPHMAAAGGGSVVYLSTTSTMEAGPLTTNNSYAAMKTAGVQHAGAQARVLGAQGIRVNIVSPGPIYFDGGPWEAVRAASPEKYEKAIAMASLGKMGSKEDVANAIVFLSSPAAGHITGANVTVDGGFTNRFDY
jgi:3-oxoacyl-[acyl-carrier protein] reductase